MSHISINIVLPGKKPLTLLLLSLLLGGAVFAQRDTSKPRTVDINSSYKPVLRNAVKVNFNAAPVIVDTNPPKLTYNIPAQNLLFRYQPVSLKPLALLIDSGGHWAGSNYIKAGFGNFQTPFVEAGFSFGDGKKSNLGLYMHHVAQKGQLKNQQYSNTGAALYGSYNSGTTEFSGKIGFNQQQNYWYGYQPNTLNFSKDSLKQKFQTIFAEAGLRNTKPTEFGLVYNPTLKISVFSDNYKATESNAVLNVPLEKSIGKAFGIQLGLTADATRYKPRVGATISNNLFYISPAVLFKTPNFSLHAGITPSWDNNLFYFLPNVTADVRLSEEKFVLQLGWVGYYNKNTYQRLAGINPWIAQPTAQVNTRVQERFAAFKGSAGDHVAYSGRVAYIQYNNMPLFVNDTIDGKTFINRNESELQVLQLHGELGFIDKENFSFNAGLTFNQFSKKKTEPEAWGLLPVEVNAALRWQILKDLWLKGDLFAWDGAKFRTKAGGVTKKDPVLDLNASLEFRITKNVNLWLQMNNLLNNKYQRWNQYEVLGFNVLGGVVFSFSQKR
jgi:TonB dependent receptor